MKKIALLSLISLAALSGWCQTAYVNRAATGTNTGTSWQNAFTDLQSALQQSGIQEIWVAGGVYLPTSGTNRSATFRIAKSLKMYGGFPATGSPVFSDRNPELHPTALSGDIGVVGDTSDNSFHVVSISVSGAARVLVDGFEVRAGQDDYEGGGMVANGGWDFDALVTVRNCTFRDNYSGYEGAAIASSHTSLVLENCLFENNYADYTGGALDFWSDHFTNTKLRLTVKDCVFRNNSTDYEAGAVSVTGHALVVGCLFESNASAYEGGALEHGGQDTLYLLNCIFRQNISREGGAYAEDGQAYLANCLFEGNVALSGSGGAINQFVTAIDPLAGTAPENALRVVNCTFVENSAAGSGGIFEAFSFYEVENSATFANCIFNENTPDGTELFSVSGSDKQISLTHCWSNASPCSARVHCIGNIQTGSTPGFFAADDYRLAPASPCINAGNNQYLLSPPPIDLAGHPRVIGSSVDLGAYEFGTSSTSEIWINARLSPNPATDLLLATLDPVAQAEVQRWEVLSTDGRLLLSEVLTQKTDVLQVPVGQLPLGIYLLRFHSERGVWIGKFSKQ